MKSTKALVILISLLLAACSPKTLPEPTNTPEPTVTSTTTPEPTPTPEDEYCNPVEFVDAFENLKQIFNEFNDQIHLITEDNPDHQSIITELTRIQNNLTKVEIPECMNYLKELMESSVNNALEGETYAIVKNYTEASRYYVKATTDISLSVDELERLADCFPDCKP